MTVGQAAVKQEAAVSRADRSSLPLEQQLPLIIQLISSKPLVSKQDARAPEPLQPQAAVTSTEHLCTSLPAACSCLISKSDRPLSCALNSHRPSGWPLYC